MGVLKGLFLNSLVEPFSTNEYYREFLTNLDTSLPAIESYTITCTCEHGTVTGAGSYASGTSFTLTCTPDEGYYLHGWTTSAGGSSNARVLTGVVSQNLTCQAIVTTEPSYEISAECICGTVTGTGLYSAGDTCTLTCVPSTDHEFSSWSDAAVSSPTRTITVSEDYFVLATCIPAGGSADVFTVTAYATPSDAATITGAGDYESRSSCTLTCTSAGLSYYTWDGWYESGSTTPLTTDYSYTISSVTSDITLEARFNDTRKYTIIRDYSSAKSYTNYHLEGADVTKQIELGSLGTLSNVYIFSETGSVVAVPDDGYMITKVYWQWVAEDGSVSPTIYDQDEAEFIYSAIPVGNNVSGFTTASQLRVWAETSEIKYKVNGSVNLTGSGTISATLDGASYTWGTEIPYSATRSMTVTFTPNTGYEFASFKIGSNYVYTNPYTFTVTESTSIIAICTVTATRVVNYSVNIPNGGDIVLQDESGQVIESGDSVLVASKLTASYDLSSHYYFTKWYDVTTSTESTSATYSFTVSDDTTPYEIRLDVAYDTNYSTIHTVIDGLPSGSTATISGYVSGGYYWEGDSVELTASLSTGLKVVKWSRSYTETGTYTDFGTTNPVTFTCPQYSAGEYWIKLTVALKDSVFDVSVPNATDISATVGGVAVTLPYSGHITDVVEVTVTYDTVKYSGLKWSDGTGSTDNPRSYTLWSESSYTLVGGLIDKPTYTVQVAATNCTVSGTGTYYEGQSCSLTCTPSSGYKFVSWTYAGSAVSTDNPYTFAVNSDTTLACACIVDGTFLVSVTTQGSGSVDGAGEYASGSTVTLTATTDDTREIKSITDNGTSVTVANPYTISSISENHTVVYNFGYKDLSISLPVGVGGSCQVYYDGVEQTSFPFTVTRYSLVEFKITPATGWHFVKWDDDVTASADRWITVTSDLLTLTFTCEEDTTTTAVPIPTTLIDK